MPLRQDETPPVDQRTFRVKNGVQHHSTPMRPARPAAGVADPFERAPGYVFDSGIHRDVGPWVPVQHFTPAGRGVANWDSWPARDSVRQREVTVNQRAGNSRARWLQNPQAPWTGLHTQVAGVQTQTARYVDKQVPQMSTRRQNHLSSTLYRGQSYSQTTVVQGAGQ